MNLHPNNTVPDLGGGQFLRQTTFAAASAQKVHTNAAGERQRCTFLFNAYLVLRKVFVTPTHVYKIVCRKSLNINLRSKDSKLLITAAVEASSGGTAM